jgi:hypothetical protein
MQIDRPTQTRLNEIVGLLLILSFSGRPSTDRWV